MESKMKCLVKGCVSNQERKMPGIVFHKLPSDEGQRKEWLKAIGKPDRSIPPNGAVCSLHFSKDSYIKVRKKLRLLSVAVPSVKLKIKRDSPRCFIPNCSSNKNPTGVTFFRVPHSLVVQARWASRIPDKKVKFLRGSQICHLHFEDRYLMKKKSFVNQEGVDHKVEVDNLRLKKGAVPTIFRVDQATNHVENLTIRTIFRLETTCRTCSVQFSDEKDCTQLFAGPLSLKSFRPDLFNELIAFGLQVTENDCLPQQICQKCLQSFSIVMQFRKQCQSVQRDLVKYFKSTENVDAVHNAKPAEQVNSVQISKIVDFIQAQTPKPAKTNPVPTSNSANDDNFTTSKHAENYLSVKNEVDSKSDIHFHNSNVAKAEDQEKSIEISQPVQFVHVPPPEPVDPDPVRSSTSANIDNLETSKCTKNDLNLKNSEHAAILRPDSTSSITVKISNIAKTDLTQTIKPTNSKHFQISKPVDIDPEQNSNLDSISFNHIRESNSAKIEFVEGTKSASSNHLQTLDPAIVESEQNCNPEKVGLNSSNDSQPRSSTQIDLVEITKTASSSVVQSPYPANIHSEQNLNLEEADLNSFNDSQTPSPAQIDLVETVKTASSSYIQSPNPANSHSEQNFNPPNADPASFNHSQSTKGDLVQNTKPVSSVETCKPSNIDRVSNSKDDNHNQDQTIKPTKIDSTRISKPVEFESIQTLIAANLPKSKEHCEIAFVAPPKILEPIISVTYSKPATNNRCGKVNKKINNKRKLDKGGDVDVDTLWVNKILRNDEFFPSDDESDDDWKCEYFINPEDEVFPSESNFQADVNKPFSAKNDSLPVKHAPSKYDCDSETSSAGRKRCKLCQRLTDYYCKECPDSPRLCLDPCFQGFHRPSSGPEQILKSGNLINNKSLESEVLHCCTFCGRCFFKIATLELHTKNCEYRYSTDDVDDLICVVCTIKCEDKEKFEKHMEDFHKDDLRPECPHCNRKFATRRARDSHIERVHEKRKEYKCETCQRVYFSKASLEDHEKRVHREGFFECKMCDATFTHPKEFRTHTLQHAERKKHKCEQCDKRFENSVQLRNHMRTHTGEKPHLCHICGRSFPYKQGYLEHVVGHEKKQGEFKCDLCSKTFSTRRKLREHKYGHIRQQNKVSSCILCKERFERRTLYLKHMEVVHGILRRFVEVEKALEFTCDICKKGFTKAYSLENHMLSMHDPQKKYVCENCGCRFIRRYELVAHLRKAHGKKKDVICGVCNQNFWDLFGLKYHSRVHEGERPYKCFHCPVAYKNKRVLITHLRRKNIPYEHLIKEDDFDMEKLTENELEEIEMDDSEMEDNYMEDNGIQVFEVEQMEEI